jgi:hypothetical protein
MRRKDPYHSPHSAVQTPMKELIRLRNCRKDCTHEKAVFIVRTLMQPTTYDIKPNATTTQTHRLRCNGPRRLVTHEAIAATHFTASGIEVDADALEVGVPEYVDCTLHLQNRLVPGTRVPVPGTPSRLTCSQAAETTVHSLSNGYCTICTFRILFLY